MQYFSVDSMPNGHVILLILLIKNSSYLQKNRFYCMMRALSQVLLKSYFKIM